MTGRLLREHWLVVGGPHKHEVITGCHCGFQADVDADSGYGDSVVRHLLTVAAAVSPGSEVREEWGVRYPAVGNVYGPVDEGTARTMAEPSLKRPRQLVRRTVTEYPDGSFLTSPWTEVER